MQGRKISRDVVEKDWASVKAGDYWVHEFDGKKHWYGMTPNGMLANLGNHEIIEYDDGTISAAPSILVSGHMGEWHGYLERGIWREV